MKINIPFLKKQEETAIEIPEIQELSYFEKIKNIIAPPGAVFNVSDFQIGEIYGKTIAIITYPRFLFAGWLENILSLEEVFNLSIFFAPKDVGSILKKLEKQLMRVSSQILDREEKGMARSPELETAYRDIEALRDLLVQAREKMFNVGVYFTIFAENKEELLLKQAQIIKILESSLIVSKPVLFQKEDAFISTLPLNIDNLQINYLLNSSTASSFFPFISSELSMERGILLGINLQDSSLVIFVIVCITTLRLFGSLSWICLLWFCRIYFIFVCYFFFFWN
ncbi:MAG: hypothetical protein QXD43_04965, partial [Candidatus Aenigmatarchaeota archaeon]